MALDQTAAMVVAVSEAIEGALSCIEDAPPSPHVIGAEGCLRAARAAVAALAAAFDLDAISEEAEEYAPNTDDAETCGHNPPYFDLGLQTMCQSCGASRVEDDSWAVL